MVPNATCARLSTYPRCSCDMCHRIWQVACALRMLQLHSELKEAPSRPGPSRQIQHSSSPFAPPLPGCSGCAMLDGATDATCLSTRDCWICETSNTKQR